MRNTKDHVDDFSPQEASQRDLLIAHLVERMSNLPKDAVAGLASLGEAIGECRSEEEFKQIAKTIREIIFPEVVGKVRLGRAGSATISGKFRNWSKPLGARIKQARLALNMKQTDLANACGLPQPHISKIESGRHSPSRKTLEKIASALRKDVGYFDLT